MSNNAAATVENTIAASSSSSATTTTELTMKPVEKMPDDWKPPADMYLTFTMSCSYADHGIDGQPLVSIGWVVGDLNSGRIFEREMVVLKSDKHSVRQRERYERALLQVLHDESLPPLPEGATQTNRIGRYARTRGNNPNREHPYEWIGSPYIFKTYWENHTHDSCSMTIDDYEQQALVPEVAMDRFLQALDGRWGPYIKRYSAFSAVQTVSRINRAIRDYTTRPYELDRTIDGKAYHVLDVEQCMALLPVEMRMEIDRRSGVRAQWCRPDGRAYAVFQSNIWLRHANKHIRSYSNWCPDQARQWADNVERAERESLNNPCMDASTADGILEQLNLWSRYTMNSRLMMSAIQDPSCAIQIECYNLLKTVQRAIGAAKKRVKAMKQPPAPAPIAEPILVPDDDDTEVTVVEVLAELSDDDIDITTIRALSVERFQRAAAAARKRKRESAATTNEFRDF